MFEWAWLIVRLWLKMLDCTDLLLQFGQNSISWGFVFALSGSFSQARGCSGRAAMFVNARSLAHREVPYRAEISGNVLVFGLGECHYSEPFLV